MKQTSTNLNTWFDPDDTLRKERKENAADARTAFMGRPFFVQ